MAGSVPGIKITGNASLVGLHWELPISIDAGTSSQFVAQVTPWIVKIDQTYPFGLIEVFPAVGGLEATFQHQNPNHEAKSGSCRTGKICLDSPYRNRAVARPGNDPVGDADERLAWHLSRAQEWVARAASGDLVRPGDPFEVPKIEPAETMTVVHDESSASLANWHPYVGQFGQVRFRSTAKSNVILASRFMANDRDRTLIRDSSLFRNNELTQVIGVWWLWAKPLAIAPWRAVSVWKELREFGVQEGIDVLGALEEISHAARDKGRILLMIGYPIPMRVGEADQEIHWETIRLRAFTTDPPKGFRANRKTWWDRDRRQIFGDKQPLTYTHTENWHPDRLQARGRLPQSVYSKNIVIIGCGALGSMLAELLIRGGLQGLKIIDGDVLAAGNLARHTLTLGSVGVRKAGALAARLRDISPSARVDAIEGHLTSDALRVRDLLDDADVVIDCTGSDEVPLLLEEPYWGIPRTFVSASFGYGARRLFMFRSGGSRFPAEMFRAMIAPWLQQERRVWSEAGERIEGPGCYSPLFPARVDDVMGGAVALVKFIEETVHQNCGNEDLVVLQLSQYGGFERIRRPEDVGVRAA